MAALTMGEPLDGLVLPELPSTPIPARVTKAYPELQEWWTDHIAAMNKWRQDASVALKKAST